MPKMYFILAALAVAALSFGLAANAQAELLFKDTFDTTDAPDSGNSYALNSSLSTRQSGSLVSGGNISWYRSGVSTTGYIQVNNTTYSSDGGNALMIGGNVSGHNHATLIDHDFVDQSIVDAGGFIVRFDIDPMAVGSTGSYKYYGGGVFIGAKDRTESNIASGFCGHQDVQADLGVLLTDGPYDTMTGALLGAYGGTSRTNAVGTAGITGRTVYDTNYAANFQKWYTCELRVTLDGDFSTGSATAEFWIAPKGGTLVQYDLDPGTTGLNYTWTWDTASAGHNYIGFFGYTNLQTSYKNVSLFDNIEISTIPEPSTSVMLACGLVGLLAYAWRKRK